MYTRPSPYSKTKMVNGTLDIIEFIDIPSLSDDVRFKITEKYAYRPDLLAYELYGDSKLWWVFAVRNKDVIKDSIYDFISGQIIFIPKIETINRAMGTV